MKKLRIFVFIACGGLFWGPAMMISGVCAEETETALLQIFVEVEDSVPDWLELSLTVTKLNVTGQSALEEHFSVTPFEGSSQLIVPSSAEGSARFLIAGEIPSGRLDMINLTLGSVDLSINEPIESGRPRFVPVVVENGAVMLQYERPLNVAKGEVLSLVVPITFGDNSIVTQDGKLVLNPVLWSGRLSSPPTPENFLNGNETLTSSWDTQFSQSHNRKPVNHHLMRQVDPIVLFAVTTLHLVMKQSLFPANQMLIIVNSSACLIKTFLP